MKLLRLFATLLAIVAMVACGDKEPIENPDNQGGAPDGALMPPSGVAVVEGTLTTTSVTIKWEAVQGAVGYQYVLQKGAMRVKSEQTTATEVTFTDLEKQTDYRFYLYALAEGGKGNSNSSEVLNFRTLSKEPSASGLPVPNLVVDCKGSGDYTTVKAAIAAIPSTFEGKFVIYIKEGTYKEKLLLRQDNVVLVGDGADKTILTWDDYQGLYNGSTESDERNRRSYTLRTEGKGTIIQDLTIENTHQNNTGSGDQAMAVEVFNGSASFFNCNITGYQDTFLGRNNNVYAYVKDSFVEGNVDFIYGNSVMLFDGCQINVNRNGAAITAPSTSAAAPYGITFIGCEVTADEVGFDGKTISKIYLGRAWKDAAKSVWIRCKMPAVLDPAGWMANMNDSVQDDKKIFAEWGCTYAESGDGDLSKRQNGGRVLTDAEAAEYTYEKIFAGVDHLAATKYEVELK